jgi:hypothetical protein
MIRKMHGHYMASTSMGDDYTSHSTARLDVHAIKDILCELEYIKNELHAYKKTENTKQPPQ